MDGWWSTRVPSKKRTEKKKKRENKLTRESWRRQKVIQQQQHRWKLIIKRYRRPGVRIQAHSSTNVFDLGHFSLRSCACICRFRFARARRLATAVSMYLFVFSGCHGRTAIRINVCMCAVCVCIVVYCVTFYSLHWLYTWAHFLYFPWASLHSHRPVLSCTEKVSVDLGVPVALCHFSLSLSLLSFAHTVTPNTLYKYKPFFILEWQAIKGALLNDSNRRFIKHNRKHIRPNAIRIMRVPIYASQRMATTTTTTAEMMPHL